MYEISVVEVMHQAKELDAQSVLWVAFAVGTVHVFEWVDGRNGAALPAQPTKQAKENLGQPEFKEEVLHIELATTGEESAEHEDHLDLVRHQDHRLEEELVLGRPQGFVRSPRP